MEEQNPGNQSNSIGKLLGRIFILRAEKKYSFLRSNFGIFKILQQLFHFMMLVIYCTKGKKEIIDSVKVTTTVLHNLVFCLNLFVIFSGVCFVNSAFIIAFCECIAVTLCLGGFIIGAHLISNKVMNNHSSALHDYEKYYNATMGRKLGLFKEYKLETPEALELLLLLFSFFLIFSTVIALVILCRKDSVLAPFENVNDQLSPSRYQFNRISNARKKTPTQGFNKTLSDVPEDSESRCSEPEVLLNYDAKFSDMIVPNTTNVGDLALYSQNKEFMESIAE